MFRKDGELYITRVVGVTDEQSALLMESLENRNFYDEDLDSVLVKGVIFINHHVRCNPFRVNEIVKEAERGAIQDFGDGVQFSGPIEHSSIPISIHQMRAKIIGNYPETRINIIIYTVV